MGKKSRQLLIIGIIWLLFLNSPGSLCAVPDGSPPIKQDLFTVEVPKAESGMREIYGEVVSISAREVSIGMGIDKYEFPFAAQTRIFCNNLPAVWQALRPVTAEAFFEAKLMVSRQNEVVYIAGLYYGEVCVVKGWLMKRDELHLKLYAAESGKTFWRTVADQARVPKEDWLQEDIEIYMLYNYQGDIRAIFLPD